MALAGVEKDTFRGGRLAGINMGHYAYVTHCPQHG
jgi:hypothetical protein